MVIHLDIFKSSIKTKRILGFDFSFFLTFLYYAYVDWLQKLSD